MNPEFHFLRPLWLLALLPFWLALWWYLRARGRGGAWARVCDAALLPFIVQHTGKASSGMAAWAAALAAGLAIVALAGPVWERLPVPVFRGDSALVIALDLSASMNAVDVKPSRLERAKFKVADILRMRTTGQTALVVFAAQSFVVTPLTDDSATLAAQLQALETSIMPNQGSEPASAIEQSAQLLRQAGMPDGHILLITDGADDEAMERARDALAGASFQLSVLGMGTAEGAPIPDAGGGFAKTEDGEIVMSRLPAAALAALADSADGIFIEASTDDSELERLLEFLSRDHDAHTQRLQELASNQWHEVGPWLLVPVLPLAALAFRRGVLALFLCVLLQAASQPAAAGWWQTPDQAGQSAFDGGRYADAARRFEDARWRGTAHYRSGDYAAAANDYATLDNAEAHYNRGNALARQGRYADAIEAYDAALERAPDHADARYNKALLEEQLQKEQPKEQDKQGPSEQKPQESDSQRGENQYSGEKGESSKEDSAAAANAGGGSPSEQNQRSEEASNDRQSKGEAERAERERRPSMGKDDQESDEAPQLAAAQNESEAERARATEQWLRQIPDDPAGLLRRKFQYQYKEMYGDAPYRGNRW